MECETWHVFILLLVQHKDMSTTGDTGDMPALSIDLWTLWFFMPLNSGFHSKSPEGSTLTRQCGCVVPLHESPCMFHYACSISWRLYAVPLHVSALCDHLRWLIITNIMRSSVPLLFTKTYWTSLWSVCARSIISITEYVKTTKLYMPKLYIFYSIVYPIKWSVITDCILQQANISMYEPTVWTCENG